MDSVNCIDVAVQACGCTQSELAKKIGVSSGQVSMWKKRGYITQKYLKKASEVTGLPSPGRSQGMPSEPRFQSTAAAW